MKLLITGGHITPALAVIYELKRRGQVEIVVAGRKYALDNEKVESFEYKTLLKKNITFVNLPAGRLTRTLSVQTFLNLLRFPGGFVHAFIVLRKEKPDKILSFGGYIALPVSLCALLLRIPIYTHEQTMRVGITNKLISKIAQKVFISFKESQKDFPEEKTILTGNPVRAVVLDQKTHIVKPGNNRPVLYVTGGSLGSHSINIHIERILDELLKTFTVIHQTGNVQQYGDYERLKKRSSSTYRVKEHVDDHELAEIYAQATMVIARAGANTISELIVLQKPSVLIPLPWSSNGEQQVQAEFLQRVGVAQVFDQKNESKMLLDSIENVFEARDEYRKNFSQLTDERELIMKASTVIVDQLLSV